jgi:uncharacterized membrane protein YraQ (UPF0718 family)
LKKEISPKAETSRPAIHMAIFPLAVLAIYGALLSLAPDKAFQALENSGNILFNMLIPLILVFILLLASNLFLKPAHIKNFLGGKPRIKSFVLSSTAGIASMGPIYAWYPLLKDMRERGAGNFPIAVFLHSRAVKPFLLPVMISYFGWIYAVTLSILTILSSLIIGYALHIFVKRETFLNSVLTVMPDESEQ